MNPYLLDIKKARLSLLDAIIIKIDKLLIKIQLPVHSNGKNKTRLHLETLRKEMSQNREELIESTKQYNINLLEEAQK